jgi:hypothetical protein
VGEAALAVARVAPVTKRLMGIRRVVDGRAANVLTLVPGAAPLSAPVTLLVVDELFSVHRFTVRR